MTERFALKTKYFSDEASRESLREEHAEMPVYGKATENKLLVGGGVVTTLLLLSGLLLSLGVVGTGSFR